MSIEQTLERIAVGIENLVTLLDGSSAVDGCSLGGGRTLPIPDPGPAPVAQAPTGGPPVGGPPQLAAVPTPMPGPSGTGPGQAMPPVAPTPAPGPQAAPAPMTQGTAMGIDMLDQIREAANTFHRTHPERAGEVWQVLSAVGAPKIDAIPAQSQAQVLQQIQALGA